VKKMHVPSFFNNLKSRSSFWRSLLF